MVKIPFFISPPYHEPPISCMRSVRLKTTKFSEFIPCSSHFGLVSLEAFIEMKSGLKVLSSSSVGLINMFFTKWACHATRIIKRTLRRVSGLAPQNASTTYNFLPDNCFATASLSSFHTSGFSGLLSFFPCVDHHTVSFEVSSITMNLSFGDRPVNFPVSTLIAPVFVSIPFSNPSSEGSVSCLKSSS